MSSRKLRITKSIVLYTGQQPNTGIGLEQITGIKRNNIAKLFIPLSFSESDLDEVLVASLDGFGARRGEIAHKPPAKRTVQMVDPVDESITILTLLEELEAVDIKIASVLNTIR